jgi:gliding motility-associated-like protein
LKRKLLLIFLFLHLFSTTSTAYALPFGKEKDQNVAQAKQYVKSRPVEFLENKGQMTDMNHQPVPFVFYKAEASGMDFYITEKGLTYVFIKSEEEIVELEADTKPVGMPFNKDEHIKTEWNRIDMTLQGASIKKENIVTEGDSKNFSQYFLPHCPDGITDVHSYKKVTIKNIYPNIDWVFYNSSEKGFKYDFVVHPGASYKQIEMVYSSLNPLQLDKKGNIEIETEIGSLTENAPVSFVDGKKIESKFIKTLNKKNENGGYNTKIHFLIKDIINSNLKTNLVIDPQLIWATFYTGNSFEGSTCLSTDTLGNVFISGYENSSDFPTQYAGTYFQGVYGGNTDSFILKFSNSGILIWATYYGGDSVESCTSLNIDIFGNLFLTGFTSSTNFPTENAGTFFQGTLEGEIDIFLLKFDNLGNRIWATYFGGNELQAGSSITTDVFGNVYVTGYTDSNYFPTEDTGTFFQLTIGGQSDLFILKFDNAGNLIWSTFYGGSLIEQGNSIATDITGNLYITGYTNSLDFPLQNAGTFFQGSYGGGGENEFDSFILKFDNVGNLLWSTYYGGSGNDKGSCIITDGFGNVFLDGITNSSNFPTQDVGTFFQGTLGGYNDVFILKFDSLGNRLWATYCGGSEGESQVVSSNDNLAIDKCNHLFFVFETDSYNLVTQESFDGQYFDSTFNSFNPGYSDGFITFFTNQGGLLWSSYFGGEGWDLRPTIALDLNDNLFVSGEWVSVTDISTYPLIDAGDGAYFEDTPNLADDIYIAKFNKNPESLFLNPDIVDAACICNGSATLNDCEYNTYLWSNGETTPSIGGLCPGDYFVTVYDAATCSVIIDTVTIGLIPDLNVFLGEDTTLCSESLLVDAQNPSSTYLWQDGSTNQVFNVNNSGTYSVVVSNGYCEDSDTINVNINYVDVNLGADTLLCQGDILLLDAQNSNASYSWQDGSSAQLYYVSTSGDYWVIVDKENCNDSDSIHVEISAINIELGSDIIICPDDYFLLDAYNIGSNYLWNTGYTGQVLEVTEPDVYSVTIINEYGCEDSDDISVQFSKNVNLGSDLKFCEEDLIILDGGKADQYLWSNGNDDRYFTVDQPGVYYVTVIYGACISQDTIEITGIPINSTLYVPNSFTPNGDGLNDLFAPVGEEITEFHLQIYSRWGEMVFESYDLEKRWNGSFNGEYLVQTGIYVYNLVYSTECSGSEKYEKHGIVNVIR